MQGWLVAALGMASIGASLVIFYGWPVETDYARRARSRFVYHQWRAGAVWAAPE